jgi:hypothetical protein
MHIEARSAIRPALHDAILGVAGAPQHAANPETANHEHDDNDESQKRASAAGRFIIAHAGKAKGTRSQLSSC